MSEYIEDLKNKGTSSINFIIGGSNGVNKELKKFSWYEIKIFTLLPFLITYETYSFRASL